MKKFLFLIVLFILSACTTQYVQQSSVAISTPKEDKIWFLNNDCGTAAYNMWNNGMFGKAKIHLVDSTTFKSMCTKIKK